MKTKEYLSYIGSDLFRHANEITIKAFFYHFFLTPGFVYMFWIRTCKFFNSKGPLFYPFFRLFWLIHRRSGFKYGLSIPWYAELGKGFYIGHYGGIVVHGDVATGANCNISQGVTIGQASRGPRKGVARLGDCVYIGPGAKLIGNISIGNRVAIGANAVVTKDLPDDAVAVGIPAVIISYKGSQDYIINTDYVV